MTEFLRFIKYRIFLILELIYNRKANPDNSNILFVNTGRIGDLLVSSVILENDEFFNGEVYFLFDKKFIKLFKSYSGKVKLIPVSLNLYRYLFLYRLYILTLLKRKKIKISINITAARGFINDEITLLSGALIRYATCANHFFLGVHYGRLFDSKYDKILFPDIKKEYEKNLNAITYITGAKINQLSLINRKTFNFAAIQGNNYICISPFSSQDLKDWDIENYKSLIEVLSKTEKILLLGSKSQNGKLKYLKSVYKNVEIINLDLDEIPEIISNCKLFVGNDSGLTHIAYRLGKPLIGIIGGGCFDIFFPHKILNPKTKFFYYEMDCFGCEWRCKFEVPHCLNNVEINSVLNCISEFIDENDKA